jgi:hypothetical protein
MISACSLLYVVWNVTAVQERWSSADERISEVVPNMTVSPPP